MVSVRDTSLHLTVLNIAMVSVRDTHLILTVLVIAMIAMQPKTQP